jgi:SAM-dependent methyltransferase
MAQFHFVEDYERMISGLIEKFPIDEAMSLAVGGAYDEIGPIEMEVLRYAGLEDGMSLIDFGCGSGRLASVLGRYLSVEYTGIDVVQSLLDYAKSKSPSHYKFLLHRALSIPVAENSCHCLCAFSVFTHLLHSERARCSLAGKGTVPVQCPVFEGASGVLGRGAGWNSYLDYEERNSHKFCLTYKCSWCVTMQKLCGDFIAGLAE